MMTRGWPEELSMQEQRDLMDVIAKVLLMRTGSVMAVITREEMRQAGEVQANVRGVGGGIVFERTTS